MRGSQDPNPSEEHRNNLAPQRGGAGINHFVGTLPHVKTALANKAAVKVAELFSISAIADLKTLYYAVAALICDVIPEQEGKQHKVPVDRKENALQTKVDKARARVS
eukprot:8065148-Ditylum_brightwellii.AAC.2